MGLVNDSDLAGFFDDAVDVATFATEKGWDEQVANLVLTAWNVARHRTRRAVAQAFPVLHASASTSSSLMPVIARSSSASSRSVTGGGAAPNPVAAPCSADLLGPVEVHAGEAHEAGRRATNLSELRKLWFTMGPRGLLWRDGTPAQHELRWTFLQRKGATLTAGTTRKHMLAWTSWVGWMHQHHPGMDIFSPDDLIFATFLDDEMAKGATLGRSRLESCRWLRLRLGVPFPVHEEVVASFSAAPVGHEELQATALTPAMFVNLVALVNAMGTAKAHEPLLALFFSVACIRRAHLARSHFTHFTETYMFGKCTEGKPRHKGVRHPFAWAVPVLPFLQEGFEFLKDAAIRMEFPNFIVPSRSAATGMAARRWTAKPMGHTTVLRILRHCLFLMGVSKELTENYTFNSCRRFLPTAAAVFHYGRNEAQALGNWVEEVTPDASKVVPSFMSIHYSDEKALSSGSVKLSVLQELLAALRAFPEAKDILNGGTALIDPFGIKWDDLAKGVKRKKSEDDQHQTKTKDDRKHKKSRTKDKKLKKKDKE